MIRKAVILAGGEGTRLQPVTLEIPKPLVPVQGVPILTWLVRLFSMHGVRDITVIYPTKWKKAFSGWGGAFPGVVLHEEREPMGTLGAIVHELDAGKEEMFVTNGDELKGLDLERLADFHATLRASNCGLGATIGLVRVPNPSDYGVPEMDGHWIGRFHEKPANPPSDLVSSGLYVLDPSALEVADRRNRYLMFEKDLFPQLAEQGRLAGCHLAGQWYDCGTMERWERAISEWKGLDLVGKML